MNEDTIYIRNLHADILIGIHPEEKEIQQPVIINIVLHADCKAAASTDNIEHAVDYSFIHDEIFNRNFG
jgi:FolB domain-containing protein